MIKKQYVRGAPGYFNNFITTNCINTPDDHIEKSLAPYKAIVAKSKNKNCKMNVKWRCKKLYTIFILRWS